MPKAIQCTVGSLEAAFKSVEMYRAALEKKAHQLQNRIAELIAEKAQDGFLGATIDVWIGWGGRQPSTGAEVEDRGKITLAIVRGPEVVFCEFGAGVHFNGSAGASPHPKGQELGFTIGSYGKGYGRLDSWSYRYEGGIANTYGTPASMPLYKAFIAAQNDVEKIAREVFT